MEGKNIQCFASDESTSILRSWPTCVNRSNNSASIKTFPSKAVCSIRTSTTSTYWNSPKVDAGISKLSSSCRCPGFTGSMIQQPQKWMVHFSNTQVYYSQQCKLKVQLPSCSLWLFSLPKSQCSFSFKQPRLPRTNKRDEPYALCPTNCATPWLMYRFQEQVHFTPRFSVSG